ncbi:MAG: pentapeptide repeat-containing protein [Cyanobacteria bacterium J06642_2]
MPAVSTAEELLEQYAAGERDFRKSNLRGANLARARLWYVNLRGADLTEADLRGVDFRRSNMMDTTLANANLQGASLRRTNFARANLQGANLERTDLSAGADFSTADLSGAKFIGATYNAYTKFPSGFDPVAQGLF